MQRRSFLAAVGLGTVGSLAGCAAPYAVPRSRFDSDADCPAGVTLCYHEVGDEAVFLVPKRERVEMGGSAGFVLVNRQSSSLLIGPDHWRLRKKEDDDWVTIPRDPVVDVGQSVPPYGTAEWTVPVTADDSVPTEDSDTDWVATETEFSPGRYCFELVGVPVPEAGERSLGALFDVVEPQ
ncbi:hypothetical protein [Haloferax larsenii]|uniref:Uncharacterized protein n=1 Tax=Haloferax larsenii TaxID=302484 RepID=A0A1H7TJK5_HALLR|nr:hypothetical protein [Haloferax larsenii]SEL84735.1 hypothetical protein SAMN04488691_10971 [Haloferax larsenii]